MQTTTTPTQTRSTPAWARYVRLAYRITAWLFIVHVAVQVFMAGMITFASPVWRAYHVQSGHMIGFYVLILPLLAVLGRAPRRITILSITVFFLFGLQYAFIPMAQNAGVMAIAALHAVNALLIFWAAITLARWSNDWR